jgi:hypothetical protein
MSLRNHQRKFGLPDDGRASLGDFLDQRTPGEALRDDSRPKTPAHPRQHLEALPRDRAVHHFRHRAHISIVLPALREDNEAHGADRQAGSPLRLRCRRDRKGLQAGGTDALPALHALPRQVQGGSEEEVLRRAARSRWRVSFTLGHNWPLPSFFLSFFLSFPSLLSFLFSFTFCFTPFAPSRCLKKHFFFVFSAQVDIERAFNSLASCSILYMYFYSADLLPQLRI